MSTINAQLLQSSATIVKDIYLNAVPTQIKNEKKLARISSCSSLILGALLLIAAWNPPQMIIWLNLLAFGGLEAVFLWPLVLGLYWEKANGTGAICGMVVGGVCYAIFASFKIELMGFHAIVPSLIFSLIAFLIGNFFGKNPVQLPTIKTSTN